MKRVFTLLAIFGLILLGCYKTAVQNKPLDIPYTPGDSSGLSSPNKAINSFIIKASDNPGLTSDVDGNVFFDTIRIVFPPGTTLTSLIPTISFTGKTIDPGSMVPQNFDSTLTYVVTATDGSILHYVVSASVR
jgi:hypothetical protein